MNPTADRPHMPGYGILAPDAGTGLLPWSWALERIAAARNFWVATVTPEGGPHAMPVWAVWDDDALWFSTSVRSRKARNLAHDPRVVITTEDALDPVVIEGRAEVITDSAAIARFLGLSNAKYNVDYQLDFLDPAVNATIVVRPERAFGLLQSDFSGSPTRWMFSD
ncbi:MAG: pyridoxamine 5-phosphate oxidase-related FMN-binding protein [Actinomycetia bacterium]|nr:pyridoxamine 5-phosphate oxidase-related FMN-binding protein [Actinomycetes bacterium]